MPFIKWLGVAAVPWSKKKITNAHLKDFLEYARTGDIFLTDTYGEVSNIFNISKENHAAIYLGERRVLEAVGAGVQIVDVEDFFFTKDYIDVWRLKESRPSQLFSIKNNAIKYLGLGYDREFETGDNEVYCFELIVSLLLDAGFEYDFKHKMVLGETVYMSDALKDKRYFENLKKYGG